MHVVNSTNFAWFSSYLKVRKQYKKITECANTVKKISNAEYRKAQYLGPLLFLFM